MRRHIPPLLAVAAAGLLTACGESFGSIEALPRELSVAEGKLVFGNQQRNLARVERLPMVNRHRAGISVLRYGQAGRQYEYC